MSGGRQLKGEMKTGQHDKSLKVRPGKHATAFPLGQCMASLTASICTHSRVNT